VKSFQCPSETTFDVEEKAKRKTEPAKSFYNNYKKVFLTFIHTKTA